MIEYAPRIARWKYPLLDFRARIVRRVTGNFSYFHIRHGYELSERRRLDLQFISHYHLSHDEDQGASIIERVRFEYYWRLYGNEFREIISQIRGKAPEEVSGEAAEYMKKWQLMSQPEPFMVEFFHGMDGQRFRDYEEFES